MNFFGRAWQTDWSLRVECFDDEVDCCDLIRIESSGVARFNFPDILDTYSFYTG